MHFAKLLSITLTILGINSQSIARDVERLQFEIPANSERGGPSLLGLTEFAHPNRVTQPLLEQFQFASGRDTFAESRLNGPMPSNFGCDAASYQPTWWLPRAAEARRASYHRILKDIACQHGLPARLLDALIAQESGFASGSVSKAGAMGMMQIMPGTARSLGLSNPFDPISNMHAGARYLASPQDLFARQR